MFAILADLGLDSLVTREIARDPAATARWFRSAGALKVGLVGASVLLLCLTLLVLRYPPETSLACLLVGAGVAVHYGALDLAVAVLTGRERMAEAARVGLVYRAILFAGGVAVFFTGGGIVALALGYLLANVAGGVIGLLLLARWIPGSGDASPDRPTMRRLVREGIPLGIMWVLNVLYFKVDMVLLSLLRGTAEVGLYSAAYRFVDALTFVPMIVTSVLFPVFSRLGMGERPALLKFLRTSLIAVVGASLLLVLAASAGASLLIRALYPAGFEPAILALRLLAWVFLFLFTNTVLNYFLVALGHQRLSPWVFGGGLVLNVALNLALIPSRGFLGAALATVLAEMFVTLLLVFAVRAALRAPIPVAFPPGPEADSGP